MDQRQKNIAIVGAGIAGLTVAWRLKRAGCNVTVFEQSGYSGGCIKSVCENGYLLEMGPNTILNSSDALWSLAGELGILPSRVSASKEVGSRRFIYKDGKLIEVPSGPKILFSPVLSLGGRLRLLKEPFIPKRNDESEESLAAFVSRRLGREVLRNLVTPFVSGIYAGDPERLCLKSVFPKLFEIERDYGGIFKGMKGLKGEIKSSGLSSFEGGMACIIRALERDLAGSLEKNVKVKDIRRIENGYSLLCERTGGKKEEENVYDGVVVACQSFAAAKLLEKLDVGISRLLRKIEYAPIVVAHLGYKKENVSHELQGFGYLVPRGENVRQLGALWSSSLFSGRAPKDRILLTNFIGGALDMEAVDLTDDDILKQLYADLSKTLKIERPPEFVSITRYAHAIPQFNLGYFGTIREIRQRLSSFHGLHIAGSYAGAVSVAGTVEHAQSVAANILNE